MIGDPLSRLDGRLKVTGAARYSAEWPMDHVAYGVVVQSTGTLGGSNWRTRTMRR